MAQAQFWFDRNGDGFAGEYRTPSLLFAMMEDKKEAKWPTLWEMWDKNPNQKRVEFHYSFALFFAGTTGEIVKALQKDEGRLQFIAITHDNRTDIRFIRKRASSTRTISIIAFASPEYWGKTPVYGTAEASPAKPWAQLEPVYKSPGLSFPRKVDGKTQNVAFAGDTIGGLIKSVQRGKGVTPWFT